jgi:hypothetical protein
MQIKARLSYLMKHGYLAHHSTLGQVCYGIEMVAAHRSDSFKVDRFAVQSSRR